MHGHDTFSSDDLGAKFTGMLLEESLHVHESVEGALEDMARDGVSIFSMGLNET